jgi:hypothetical protein
MKGLASILSVVLLSSCASLTSPSDVESIEVIMREWKVAQDVLAPVLGDAVYKVSWNRFSWRTYHGDELVPCSKTSPGYIITGCLSGDTIRWHSKYPGVIQHEAGHGIMKKLGHHCWRDISIDGGRVTYHTQKKEGTYCQTWIQENF